MKQTTNTPAMDTRKTISAHINMQDACNPAVHATLAEKAGCYIQTMPGCPQSLRRVVREVLLIFTRLVQDGRGDIPWETLCLLAAAVLYLLCPVDAVPDALPVLGWADDLAVLLYALNAVKKRYETGKGDEAQQGETPRTPVQTPDTAEQ